MNNVVVRTPSSIDQHTRLLESFVYGMVQKLDKNSHKATPTLNTIPEIIDFLKLEIDEFETQFFEDRDNENTVVELFDIANFAFLAYIALKNKHEYAS